MLKLLKWLGVSPLVASLNAAGCSLLAFLNWRLVRAFGDMHREYPPEVWAAAGVHDPPGLRFNAWLMTFLAVCLWLRVYRLAPKD